MSKTAILTNPNVGLRMSELEVMARRGDPWAQRQLTKAAMGFAVNVIDDVRAGADMVDRKDLMKVNK